jgi:hypothetical protein
LERHGDALLGARTVVGWLHGLAKREDLAVVCLLLVGLGLFLIFRAATWFLWMFGADDVADTVLNRLAWVCGDLVLVVLLASWMDAVHSQFSHGTPRFLFGLKFGISAFAVAYTLAMIIPTIVFLVARRSGGTGARMAYDATIWVRDAVGMVLSLTFLVMGLLLSCY